MDSPSGQWLNRHPAPARICPGRCTFYSSDFFAYPLCCDCVISNYVGFVIPYNNWWVGKYGIFGSVILKRTPLKYNDEYNQDEGFFEISSTHLSIIESDYQIFYALTSETGDQEAVTAERCEVNSLKGWTR